LELERAVRDLLTAHLAELDRAFRQGRYLLRHLLQLLLHPREKLVVRGCAASTLQLDAHLPSWTLGTSILRGESSARERFPRVFDESSITARSSARSTPRRPPAHHAQRERHGMHRGSLRS